MIDSSVAPPVPLAADVASVQAAYDEWHGQHQVDQEASAPWYDMIKKRMLPKTDLANRRVLEIGCGLGGFAVWLSRHTYRPQAIVAADFSPVAIRKANQYGTQHSATNIEWTVADIQSLDQFGEEFDTVFSCETIEHVLDPPLAVHQLARVLKPGGRLYLTTPNYFSMIGLYRAYCWFRGKKYDEGGQPICQVNMAFKTRRWVKSAGLQVVLSDGVGHYFPFPGRPPLRMRFLDGFRPITWWFAHHTLVIGQKPHNITPNQANPN